MTDCNRCYGSGMNRHGTFYCPKCLGSGNEEHLCVDTNSKEESK